MSKPHLRISVTNLDGHDYLLRSESSRNAWLDLFLNRKEQTDAMKNGICFEDWLILELDNKQKDHNEFMWEVKRESVVPLIPEIISSQVPALKFVGEMLGYDVYLSGRIDAIGGNGALIDWKSTGVPIEFERYHDSWQWRAYLWMLDYPIFDYHIFRIKGLSTRIGGDGGRIQEYSHFRMTKYDEMYVDVTGKVANYAYDLLQFVRRGEIIIDSDGRPHANSHHTTR